MVTNCRNCGAPIDISRETCAYCDSPYVEKPKDRFEMDSYQRLFLIAAQNAIMTSNEIRGILYANDEPIAVV
ncbi:hypothetical protein [Fibrobacter sp.]|uniref:hypothetical protein n=1 Tax=Fibrobacter sp. TaxID=35828 RepID=UPI00388F82DF